MKNGEQWEQFVAAIAVLSLCSCVAYAYLLKRLTREPRRMTKREFRRFMRAKFADFLEAGVEELVLKGAVDPHTGRFVQLTDDMVKPYLRSFYWHYPDLKPQKRKQEGKLTPAIRHELDAVAIHYTTPKKRAIAGGT